jgi:hypothetical protein
MAVNSYFNKFDYAQEQTLVNDLVVEAIQIYGVDMKYLPRTKRDYDGIYGEDASSAFNNAYDLEMYVRNVDGFGGDGDLMTKFNIIIRDTITFTVAGSRFLTEVGGTIGATRPREGDLLWFPLTRKIYEIKFVEHESVFYQVGKIQSYDLRCELYEYGGEEFSTGLDYIDTIQQTYSTVEEDFFILTEDGLALASERSEVLIQDLYTLAEQVGSNEIADNLDIQEESDEFLDFTESNPFAEKRI